MKKILLSFIGNNDCLLASGKEGAIISILRVMAFDRLYILYNHDRYLQFASEILVYCRKHFPQLDVKYEPAKALDPTDYNFVYPSMYAAVKNILSAEKREDTEYTVSVTSGTPTMHACWLFLKQGGILPAKLIQVSREQGIHEITFSLDDFPQIDQDKAIKAKLTSLNRENIALKQQLNCEYDEMIGQHPALLEIKQQMVRLAKYSIPVFIGGESGTGKELAAKGIHYNSPRKEKPFIAVNCGSISENLFESEFFGHKKGSYTGAIADHDGFFSQADKGTLFLDEVGDLPLAMQVKLLRVLETGHITPVGGKEKKVDVRVISASNQNLNDLIKLGKFREDLFFRLVQAKIFIPPLRERQTDILLLANHFLSEFGAEHHQHKTLAPDTIKKLLNSIWKGNIRELRNTIINAYINSSDDIIKAEDIILQDSFSPCSEITIPPEGIDLDNEVIPSFYKSALKLTNGNKAKAAKLLGLEPHTFRARLKSTKLGKDNNRQK